MSYEGAKNGFTENCKKIGNPMADPQLWNLNHALFQLTVGGGN